MAYLYPSSIKNLDESTPGEIRIFDILKQGLSPTSYVWYEMVLGEREHRPDFMVLDREYGMFILEAKDWARDTILKADKNSFLIKSKGKSRYRNVNPEFKCQNYIRLAKQEMVTWEELRDDFGRLNFPVEFFTVFKNISFSDFEEMELDRFMDAGHVIFSAEVNNRNKFMGKMFSHLEKLPEPLSDEQVDKIRITLRKEVTIDSHVDKSGLILPGLSVEDTVQEFSQDSFAIDIQQEEIAKNLGKGPRLLRGMAGSGKTLIMLIRAKMLASNAEHMAKQSGKKPRYRGLILCWNVSLASYMQQAFDNINIPLEDKRLVKITNFGKFVGELKWRHPEVKDIPWNEDKDIINILEKLKITEKDRYDFVVVDEAQDFHDSWLEFLFKNIVRGKDADQKIFLLAADDAQKVYKDRKFTWKSIGIPLQGRRSRILRVVYRNSARVWGFAGILLGNIKDYYDGEDSVYFAPKRGIDPKLIGCKDENARVEAVVKEIKAIGDTYSLRNVLIIYRGNKQLSKNLSQIEKLTNRLDKEKIPYQWISKDKDSKRRFDWVHESVKISTAHSAKGMDAPKVIIYDAEDFRNKEDEKSDDRKLLYVALTRAREELVILHVGERGLVPALQKALVVFMKHKKRFEELEDISKKLWGYDANFWDEQMKKGEE